MSSSRSRFLSDLMFIILKNPVSFICTICIQLDHSLPPHDSFQSPSQLMTLDEIILSAYTFLSWGSDEKSLLSCPLTLSSIICPPSKKAWSWSVSRVPWWSFPSGLCCHIKKHLYTLTGTLLPGVQNSIRKHLREMPITVRLAAWMEWSSPTQLRSANS